jgi:TldD protein
MRNVYCIDYSPFLYSRHRNTGNRVGQSRREFIKSTSQAAALAGLAANFPTGRFSADALLPPPSSPYNANIAAEPNVRELAMIALDAAKSAGASYADVRFVRNRNQNVSTREQRVSGVADNETYGFGVRTLVNGAWGFAASRDLTKEETARVARQAVAQARANRSALVRPVELAAAPVVANGTWKSPIEIDPFTVPIEEKVGALLAANQAALAVKGARFVNSSMFFLREEKTFASTDGSFTFQVIYRTQPAMTVTATANGDFASRESVDVAPRGLGYEHVRDSHLLEMAPKWADEAVQKLTAKSVDVGRYDLVLHPSHLWLTIHESVAHPTELDRAMGYEANYAGTSFVAPPASVLGKLKYGSELMNIRGDRRQPGSLSAVGWDDEGVQPEDFDIISKGVFVDYQTTREQAPWLHEYYTSHGKPTRSHGCSYAQTWAAVQFQRMPNVSLLPGDKDLGWDDLIAATDRGIAIVGDGSFSIDQQRYNAQFGGQVFYEIKGGKIVGMLKDVAYQMKTPEFWASLDMIGGQKSYFLGGAFGDAKGQPVQVNAVSHGAPVTRFRNVNVINTGRTA